MNPTQAATTADRCRLILIAPAGATEAELSQALAAGNVASVVLARGDLDDAAYVRNCQALVPAVQAHDVPALVVNDTVAAGRSGADGILIEQPGSDFRDIAARFSPQKIVGFGGVLTRHRALELGEAEPDFMLFGKVEGDLRPEPHPKNLALAEWWSKIVEIPCVVMAGSAPESIGECAASGAEFVACRAAVFEHGGGVAEAVEHANRLLEEHGRFPEDD